MGRWPSAGATAVRAQRQRRHAGGHRHRAAARRAAGRQRGVLRMPRQAIDHVGGQALAGELRGVAHAKDDGARRAQPFYRNRISRRDEVAVQQGTLRHAAPAHPHDVLDDHRHAGKRRPFARGQALAQLRDVGVDQVAALLEHRIELTIARVDPCLKCRHHGAGIEFAGVDLGGDGGGVRIGRCVVAARFVLGAIRMGHQRLPPEVR